MNNMTTVYESLSSNNSFVSLSGTPGSNDDDEQSEFNDVDVDEEVEDKSYKSCDDNESKTNLMMNKSGHSHRSRISKTGSKRSKRSKRSKGTSSGGSRSRRSVGSSSFLELKGNNMLEFESEEDADVSSSDDTSFDEEEQNSISRFLQGYRDNRDSDGYDTDTDNDEEDGIRFINTTIQLPHTAKATAAANSAKARLLTMPFSKSNNNYDFFSSSSSGRRKTRNKRHSRRRRNGNKGLLSSNRNIIYILCGAILLSLSYYLIDISTRRQQNDTQRFIINKYRHKNNLMLRSSSGESNSTQLGMYNNAPQKNSGVIVLGAPFSGESILTYALAMGGFRLASSNEMNSLKDILQLPENHRRKKKKKSKHNNKDTKKKKTHDRYEPSMYSDQYSKGEEEGDEDTIPLHIEPFERQDFHDENDILLSDQGLSWDSHRIYEFDDKTANARIRRENFLENSQILSFLNGGESDTDPWIWQDPQVCITLNPWMKVLQHLGTQHELLEVKNNDNTTTTTTKTLPPDAAAIITFKNPFDMAHSLHSNFPHQISFLKGLQIWLDYNFKCMTNILDLGICFIATFHSTLIGDPLHEVNRIMKDLDYACHISPGYPGLLGHDAAKQIMNDMESMEVPFVLPYRKATSTISSSTSATTEINNVIVEESEEALNEEDLVTVHSLNYIKQEKEEEDDELDKEEEEGEEDWEREIILDALGILDIFQDRDFLNCEHGSSINHDNNNDGYHSNSYNYDPETEFSYLDPDFVEETELQQQNLNPDAKNKDEIHTWGSIHLSEVIEELSQLENEHLLSSSSSANTGSEKGSDSNMEAALKFRQQRLSLETKFKNELSNWVGKSEADAFHQLIHLEQEMTNQYVNDGLIGVASSTTSSSSGGAQQQQQQNDMLLQTQLKIREERVNLIQKYRKNIRRGVLESQKVYCDMKNGKAFKRTYLWPQEEQEQNN